jgi:hypothetical protein
MSALKKSKEKVDLGFVTIELIRPQIVCITCLDEETISVEKGIQLLQGIQSLVEDMRYATIINLSDLYTPSKEFFKFIVSQRSAEKDNIIARGIVTTNMAARIDSQNFIGFFKPLIPTKIFSTIDEAVAWVEPQLSNVNNNL